MPSCIVLRRPGANFINILRTAFGRIDPKSVKKYWWLDWVLTLWEATCVIALQCWWNWPQEPISSTFYACLFCTKTNRAAFSSDVSALKLLAPKFCTKNAHVKCWWNWLQRSLVENKNGWYIFFLFSVTKVIFSNKFRNYNF